MKVTNKVIEDVVSEVAGADTVPLILAIKDKKNISEFKIADMLKEQINITRNMLYRLLDQNLVNFIRKKDRQKGWYIYYWTFNPKQVRFLTFKLQKQKLLKLRERLEREKSAQFFACPNGCIRLDFEQSMNFEFKCPECGSIIQHQENALEIQKIEHSITESETLLNTEFPQPLAELPRKAKGAAKRKILKKHLAKKPLFRKIAIKKAKHVKQRAHVARKPMKLAKKLLTRVKKKLHKKFRNSYYK